MVGCIKNKQSTDLLKTSGLVTLLELGVAVVHCLYIPGGAHDMLVEVWHDLFLSGPFLKVPGYNEGIIWIFVLKAVACIMNCR